MRLWSNSWINGDPIPARCAATRIDPATGKVVWSANRHPHLAWDEVPAGTLSFALIAQDFDGLPDEAAGLAEAPVPEDLPRRDFFHWVLADLPASLREIPEAAMGEGFVPGGQAPKAWAPMRSGLNDLTRWFASDAALAGRYLGYDGPLPPVGDPLVHHYVVTLHALDVARAPVDDPFDGEALRRAIYPHVLAAATLSGTYSLHPRHRT